MNRSLSIAALALAIVASTNQIGAHVYIHDDTGKPAMGWEVKKACESGELPAMDEVCQKYRRTVYFPVMRKKATLPQ